MASASILSTPTYLRNKALSSYFIFWWSRREFDARFIGWNLFKLTEKKNDNIRQSCLVLDNLLGELIEGGMTITIILTRPFLRFACTFSFPLLKLCSIKEMFWGLLIFPSTGWTICFIVAFIEDIYSRAAVARVSCRSECNNQNKLDTSSEIKKERKKTN